MKKKYAQTREEMLLSLIHREKPMAFDFDGANCAYDHSVNGGCAIGCQMPPARARKLENTLVYGIVATLPKRMQKMGATFLSDVQYIHDCGWCWINFEAAEKAPDGLVWSNRGREEINKIITGYKLNIEKLKMLE